MYAFANRGHQTKPAGMLYQGVSYVDQRWYYGEENEEPEPARGLILKRGGCRL